MRDVGNMEDVLNTSDIEERIEELEAESESDYDEYVDERIDCEETAKNYDDWYEENKINELDILKTLYQDCLDTSCDTPYGEILIRYSYFSEYTQDLCEDCGYIANDFPSWIEIDWDATAENVKQDYTIVDFDGIDYYMRSC